MAACRVAARAVSSDAWLFEPCAGWGRPRAFAFAFASVCACTSATVVAMVVMVGGAVRPLFRPLPPPLLVVLTRVLVLLSGLKRLGLTPVAAVEP